MTRRLVTASVVLGLSLAAPASGQSPDAPAGIPEAEKRSGYHFQSRETQAMQDDDLANPGYLWVMQGAELWSKADGQVGKSCQSCHGDAAQTMKGVAVRYPAFDAAAGRPINLEQRINQCRTERQQAPALANESQALLALTAFVAHQSRGMPVQVSVDGPARPFFEAGRTFYYTRMGQLNLACNHCHEQNWGQWLRGDRLTQGHGNGYPIYRLDWQTMGSLHRRLRSCNIGVRAEPYDYGAPEYVNLELFLAWRAQGLPVEAPAVRR